MKNDRIRLYLVAWVEIVCAMISISTLTFVRPEWDQKLNMWLYKRADREDKKQRDKWR